MTPTEQDKGLDKILPTLQVETRAAKTMLEQFVACDKARRAIMKLITADRKRVALEAVKSYEDNLLSTIDDISNKPWRAARHIRELYENTDSGSSDWYKQVADDWRLLEEFFSNDGMGKVRELMADPNFNVNYPERIAQLDKSEADDE